MLQTIRCAFLLLVFVLGACAATAARAEFTPGITWLELADEVHVRADASTVTTVRSVARIDTEAGVAAYAERRIGFSASLQTLEILHAWTQTPDGRRLELSPDKIRTADVADGGGPEFSDAKVKVLIYPAVQVGSTLHLGYRLTQHTPYFAGHSAWSRRYGSGSRIERASVQISHDAGVPLKVQARGAVGGRVPPRADDAPGTVRYAFTYRQDKALAPEPQAVDQADFAPFVQATTFADRAALAAAYQSSARPQAEPNQAIRELAVELTAGATTERDKVKALYHWVSRHLRYVSLVIGAGGYVPNSAASILEHRYGDCKDHVTLLEALLRAVGVDSTPALVNAGRAMRLPDLAMLGPFDHVITYVPSLDLYLDATARFAPMGSLPTEVMDKPVLLTASGREARTPRTRPDADYTHAKVWMQVGDSGNVRGKSLSVMRGTHEVDSRSAQFDNLGQRQEGLANDYLSRFGETGTARIDVDDPLDLSRPWEVRASFVLDPVVNIPGPSAMTIPVGLAPGTIRALATERPVSDRQHEFVCTAGRHLEEIELRLPVRARIERIPRDVMFRRGPLHYESRYRRTGRVVQVRREFIVDRASHTCTARDDEDWAAMLGVLQRDLRGQVFIR